MSIYSLAAFRSPHVVYAAIAPAGYAERTAALLDEETAACRTDVV